MVNKIVLSAMSWGSSLRNAVTTRIREENGQDLIEYVVLAGGIGIALFAAFAFAPIDFTGFISAINNCISMSGTCP